MRRKKIHTDTKTKSDTFDRMYRKDQGKWKETYFKEAANDNGRRNKLYCMGKDRKKEIQYNTDMVQKQL